MIREKKKCTNKLILMSKKQSMNKKKYWKKIRITNPKILKKLQIAKNLFN